MTSWLSPRSPFLHGSLPGTTGGLPRAHESTGRTCRGAVSLRVYSHPRLISPSLLCACCMLTSALRLIIWTLSITSCCRSHSLVCSCLSTQVHGSSTQQLFDDAHAQSHPFPPVSQYPSADFHAQVHAVRHAERSSVARSHSACFSSL
jgi:hypothetical protein